jgi:hypothetical protein
MMRDWRVVDLPFIHLIGSAAEVAASSWGERPASTHRSSCIDSTSVFQMIITAAWQELTVKGSSNYDSDLELSGTLYMSLCRQLLVNSSTTRNSLLELCLELGLVLFH